MPPLQLFCCPCAGGSSLAYKRWPELGAEFDILTLDYPGRFFRADEPRLLSVSEIVDQLYEEIGNCLRVPFAFVGASLGALVAFELAKKAEANGFKPAFVLLCACASPDRLGARGIISSLSDDDFISSILKLYGGGLGRIKVDDDVVREHFLPIMRADITAFETYRPTGTKIASDMIVGSGSRDRSTSYTDVQGWCRWTEGSSEILCVDGDHFFVEELPELLVAEMRKHLVGKVPR